MRNFSKLWLSATIGQWTFTPMPMVEGVTSWEIHVESTESEVRSWSLLKTVIDQNGSFEVLENFHCKCTSSETVGTKSDLESVKQGADDYAKSGQGAKEQASANLWKTDLLKAAKEYEVLLNADDIQACRAAQFIELRGTCGVMLQLKQVTSAAGLSWEVFVDATKKPPCHVAYLYEEGKGLMVKEGPMLKDARKDYPEALNHAIDVLDTWLQQIGISLDLSDLRP